MSRNPKTSKELILQTSLNLLIREGYSSVTIKNISKELHCSTQPISWHFGNMSTFRISLLEYVLKYTTEKYPTHSSDSFYSFYLTGRSHLEMAVNTPYLFRYLYMGESGISFNESTPFTSHCLLARHSVPQIADSLGISIAQALELINTMIFYTQGLSTMIVNQVINDSPENIFQMFNHTTINLLTLYGIPTEIALKHCRL